jgi:hypothetical protein
LLGLLTFAPLDVLCLCRAERILLALLAELFLLLGLSSRIAFLVALRLFLGPQLCGGFTLFLFGLL